MPTSTPKPSYKILLPEKEKISAACEPYLWGIGNQVLYEMCGKYPAQQDVEAVANKFWLIGRAYAASLERRQTSNEPLPSTGDDFYRRFAQAYVNAQLDAVFAPLWTYDEGITEDNLLHILDVHSRVSSILKAVTGQWKISLASKYLHFHFPTLIFIYDSRAAAGLRQYVPRWPKVPLQAVPEYSRFCAAMLLLRNAIAERNAIRLTPRQLDRLLLTY